MFKKPIHLYIATSTWFASTGAGEPNRLQGEHTGLVDQDWKPLCKALSSHFGKSHKVNLVLSAAYCRFITTPWVSSKYTHKSIHDHVIDTFARNQGVTLSSHHICIQWPKYGAPVLAVGYPHDTLNALRLCLDQAGITLAEATASVFAIHHRYGPFLPSGDSLLAYAEDDGLTAITLEQGALAQVEWLPGQGVPNGLDGIDVWSARKRFEFSDDEHMCWLANSAMPSIFPGMLIQIQGEEQFTSPGHAIVAACQ